MSLKKLIQASTGIAVLLGSAGTANALNLSITQIADDNTGFTTKAPLKYASEIQQGSTTGANNDRDETEILAAFDVETGTFPSGNVVVTATITGGVFDRAFTKTDVDVSACTGVTPATANISTGGNAGDTTVSWVFSNLDACNAGQKVVLTLPVDLDLGGAGVSATVGIVTESGSTPVDGGPETVSNFLVAAPAYSAEIKAGPAATVIADVSETTGAYRLFDNGVNPNTKNATLGSIEIKADTTVAIDLSGTVVTAAVADYDKVAIAATGDFSAFLEADPTDQVRLAGEAATTKTASGATFSAVQGTAFNGAFGAPGAVTLVTDGDTAIPASTYSVTVTPTLDAALTGLTVGPTSGTLSNIARNGTSVRLPWVVSGTQAGASGTGATNFIRVTNRTAVPFGPITATVLASNQSGSLGATTTLAPSLAPGAELLVNSVDLEAKLGSNYGRGDIEVTVEGAGATVVQLVARPDGVYTIDNQ